MLKRLDELEKEALDALESIRDEQSLQDWKVKFLGRSAELGKITESLSELPKEERPAVGRRANEVKRSLEAAYEQRSDLLRRQALERELLEEQLDVTLPGRRLPRGRIHPANQVLRRITDIFAEMGFQIYRSREVETDDYNFGLLNMPAFHPARDQWDTFYTTEPGVLLRTHTSPGQIHVMRERAPEPIRVVLPGM
jgi:phenylalanyl-tRNA synthetase alpha chain